jgi:hypothetical protein
MSETVYIKRGRRYVPFSNWERDYGDSMKVGTFRLTYAYADGSRRYAYDVRPDTAGFVAACEVARQAMEAAIQDAAIAAPSAGMSTYTGKQRALIERFRADMAAAGGLVPTSWNHASARDISQAAIDAAREYKP